MEASRPARQKPHGPTTTEEDKYETQDFRGPCAPDGSRRRLWRRWERGYDNLGPRGRPASLEGVELSLWGWSSSDAENTALSDLVAQFSEETGAVATFQPQAEYDVALQAALTSGDPPDVFYVDSFRLPDLADAGALAPVPEGAVTNPDDIYPVVAGGFHLQRHLVLPAQGLLHAWVWSMTPTSSRRQAWPCPPRGKSWPPRPRP